MALLAPSILSANFADIKESVLLADKAGADVIHIDIMDGHFVPNLTFGPKLVSAIKKISDLPVDVHLMVDNPSAMIPLFLNEGADWISIHIETSNHLHKDIDSIKEHGKKAGLVLNPATPIHHMKSIIHDLDYVLVMTVNPGFGGQKFIQASHLKITNLKNWIKGQNLKTLIEIDGGISLENIDLLLLDGADVFVAGNSIFNSEDPIDTIHKMKSILSGKPNS